MDSSFNEITDVKEHLMGQSTGVMVAMTTKLFQNKRKKL